MLNQHWYLRDWEPACFKCGRPITKDNHEVVSFKGRYCGNPSRGSTIWFCSTRCAENVAIAIKDDVDIHEKHIKQTP